MRVIVADKAGFCQGVKRALDLAIKEATQSPEPVYTFGPLVHNNQVITYLEDLGIERIDEALQAPPGSHVIIRSHGIGPLDMEKLEEQELTIIDATCVKVKQVQDFAKSLIERGYALIVLGAPEHPEIKAIREYINDRALVIHSLDEIIEPLFNPIPEKVGLVSQTTLSKIFFDQAVEKIRKQIPNLEVHNTICGATETRQEEARKVAERSDMVIVIGSPFSSNTSRLAEVCVEHVPVKKIETEEDISEEWFTKNMTVGVTAGASTPEWVIKQVLKVIISIGEMLDGECEVINGDMYLTKDNKSQEKNGGSSV